MTFKVFSLGCKVNSYECSSLSSLLIKEGFSLSKKDQKPDVFIINTCSVTATADQKSRQHIRKFKKMYPDSILVVMGCYAQGDADYIWNEIQPTILVGTSNRNKIIEYIKSYQTDGKRILAVEPQPRDFTKFEELGITSFSENVRAYLKIQDGCDNFCTYCLIPYRRGKARSRLPENVISEAKYLVSQGYKEIILTGIHVGGYGRDLGNTSFSDLTEALLDIEGLNSLRISSIEESEIDEKLINLINTRSNLAKHLHIPLQAGSETVLKRMGRRYTPSAFLTKINEIKSACPDVALTTDVILGFPGETDLEFEETYNFIKECGFNMLHVFPYSQREGTPAAKMPNQINPQIKAKRASILLDLSKSLWNEYVNTFIGKEVSVLIEKYENGANIGHTTNYIEVSIPSLEGKVGEYIDIKLQKSMIIS